MGKIVLATIIISGSAKWLLKVGGNKEKWYGSDRIFMYVMTVFGAMTVNYSEQCTEYGWVVSNLRLLAGCLLAGGLLSAAYMDRRNCWVYNYVWWWCLPWAGILGLTAGGEFSGIVAVLVFVMLQQLLFSRMYGKADCHAFSVCALAECGNAVGMDVPLSRVIDNRAAASGKCHSKRQTARTTAVYSLYYHSIFFRNVPRKCF